MKKKLLILAAVAVSGVAAVVASNVINADACNCIIGTKEGIRNTNMHVCCQPGGFYHCPYSLNGSSGWVSGTKVEHPNGD